MMIVPLIYGKPLNVWLGFLLLAMLAFQIFTGKRWIKLPIVYHRRNAMAMTAVALLHAFYGFGLWFLGFHVR